jgi:hypothetical protein
MKAGTSQDKRWTWLQVIQGLECEAVKHRGPKQKMQELRAKHSYTIVPRIRYLGFTLKEKRVPWLQQGIFPLANQTNFDTHINRQQAHFLARLLVNK